ncbi:hypothetical protein Bpfe_019006, partial [Biomphalaria pfeifferi]
NTLPGSENLLDNSPHPTHNTSHVLSALADDLEQCVIEGGRKDNLTRSYAVTLDIMFPF